MDLDKVEEVKKNYDDGKAQAKDALKDGRIDGKELSGFVATFKTKKGLAAIAFAISIVVTVALTFFGSGPEETKPTPVKVEVVK